jgi:carbamoyltransferase
MRTEMDCLVMGSYILDKQEQPKFAETADWKTEFKLD